MSWPSLSVNIMAPFTQTASEVDSDDDLLSLSERLAKSCLSKKTKKTSHTSSLLDRINMAVEAFFNQELDPEEVLKDKYKRMGKDCSTVNWEKVKGNETMYISSLFDSLEWWG